MGGCLMSEQAVDVEVPGVAGPGGVSASAQGPQEPGWEPAGAVEWPTDEEGWLRCLADPWWRLTHLYRIADEDGKELAFKPNDEQRDLYGGIWYWNLILKARQLGFCVVDTTRVLTADLRWVAIRDLELGQEIVAVDEHPPGGRGKSRRMRTASVLAKKTMQAQAWRVRFDDGREVVCTDRHPWLSRKSGDMAEWRSLSGEGNQVVGRLNVGTQVRWVCKPWDEVGVEDGWMGGMLDGEGSMSKANSSAGVNVSQRPGPVWDRLVAYARDRGYNACVENDVAERPSKHGRVPVPKLAFGRMDEMFRLMGQTRPTRFIGRRWWEGRELPGKRNGDSGWATIVAIEPVGEQTVVDLQTSTGTYIAEGFVSHNTTLLTIMALDQCLFVGNFTAAIVFHNLTDAEKAFRNKVKFAYERLPEALRSRLGVRKETGTEIVFENGSSLGVGVSARSGTIQWLHVSEFGKMCAKFPEKAREVVTGSFNAVPKDGLIFIESTAEGQAGFFYDYCMEALKRRQEGLKAARGQFKLHFYPWWGKKSYVNDDPRIAIDADSRTYFEKLQVERGIVLTLDQKRWYVAKAATQGEDMKREYPSYPEEAFEQAIVGAVYGKQMEFLRTNHRITSVPWEPSMPVHTFWDLGQNDATAIWFMQRVGMENRFIDYEEETGEGFAYFVKKLRERPYLYELHHLPHDARVKRQAEKGPESPEMILKRLGVYNLKIVTRVHDVTTGIDLTRSKLPTAWIDRDKCAKGIKALDSYQFEWDENRAMFTKVPLHNWASNGADAMRQWAQGFMEGSAGSKGFRRHRGSWRA